MSDATAIVFPCDRCPDEPGPARLLGIYDQRQEGLLMQRVKVHAGRISAAQWRAVAKLAATYTPDYPLHLTTRQDIELHGIKPADIPAIQRGLADVGLTTVGACGDTLRNVTTCPSSGLAPGCADVIDIADVLRRAAESLPFIRTMPRKFKISVSSCQRGCARPWINDLGLIAEGYGAFRAILAGSLGARPGTGIELYRDLRPDELVPLTVAALRLFNDEGDRERRARARLRHVRERLGDEVFAERLDALFETAKKEGSWPVPELPPPTGRAIRSTRLHPPLGDIMPDAALALADALEAADGQLRLGLEHDLFVFGEVELDADLRAIEGGPSIVACPGSTWCERGIADSRAAALQIREALPDDCELTICLNGCPNNCGHAAVADIGLTGRIATVGDARAECFRLLAGGDNGHGPALAEEIHPAVPAAKAADAVAQLVAEYAAGSLEGESFGKFVRREKNSLADKVSGIAAG